MNRFVAVSIDHFYPFEFFALEYLWPPFAVFSKFNIASKVFIHPQPTSSILTNILNITIIFLPYQLFNSLESWHSF